MKRAVERGPTPIPAHAVPRACLYLGPRVNEDSTGELEDPSGEHRVRGEEQNRGGHLNP